MGVGTAVGVGNFGERPPTGVLRSGGGKASEARSSFAAKAQPPKSSRVASWGPRWRTTIRKARMLGGRAANMATPEIGTYGKRIVTDRLVHREFAGDAVDLAERAQRGIICPRPACGCAIGAAWRQGGHKKSPGQLACAPCCAKQPRRMRCRRDVGNRTGSRSATAAGCRRSNQTQQHSSSVLAGLGGVRSGCW